MSRCTILYHCPLEQKLGKHSKFLGMCCAWQNNLGIPGSCMKGSEMITIIQKNKDMRNLRPIEIVHRLLKKDQTLFTARKKGEKKAPKQAFSNRI
jgi:hypothetical protein